MKCFILISILICSISSFCISPLSSNNKSTLTAVIESKPLKDKLSQEDIIKLKIKDFEKHIGKKLTIKEKIAFKIVQHNLRKVLGANTKPDEKNKGKTAFILGISSIIALCLVFIPYAFIASLPLAIIAIDMGNKAKKIDPSDKKARAAVILGWITIGLLSLFLLFLLAALIVILVLIGLSG